MKINFTAFGNFGSTFFDSSRERFAEIFRVVDDVFLAVAIILLGWFVGRWIRHVIAKVGEKLHVSHFSEKIGFTHLLQKANIKSSPARVIGEFVNGYILTIFLIGAANILGFYQISQFLDDVIAYIPHIAVALVIVLLGMRVAATASAILENTLQLTHSSAAKTLALTAKYIIISFALLAALFQLKIAADLVQILFTGFIAMIALAGGLAFGLGGKDIVREFLEDLKAVPTKKRRSTR